MLLEIIIIWIWNYLSSLIYLELSPNFQETRYHHYYYLSCKIQWKSCICDSDKKVVRVLNFIEEKVCRECRIWKHWRVNSGCVGNRKPPFHLRYAYPSANNRWKPKVPCKKISKLLNNRMVFNFLRKNPTLQTWNIKEISGRGIGEARFLAWTRVIKRVSPFHEFVQSSRELSKLEHSNSIPSSLSPFPFFISQRETLELVTNSLCFFPFLTFSFHSDKTLMYSGRHVV